MNNFRRLRSIYIKRLASIRRSFIRYNSDKTNSHESNAHLYLLTIPVISFGLGTWQVKRLEWKKGLIRDMEIRTHSVPIPLPSDVLEPGRMAQLDYRPVFVEGEFDHSQEILLGPRSLTLSGPNTGGALIGPAAKSGYQIVTPFVLNSGDRILINRGWVPREKKDPQTRMDAQVKGKVKISGLLRSDEKRPTFTPKIQADSHMWHYRDLGSFSHLLDTLPIFIDADSTSTIKGGPIGGQTKVHLRNEHMQYIITWYSLCVATLLLYYQLRRNPGAMFRGGPTIKE